MDGRLFSTRGPLAASHAFHSRRAGTRSMRTGGAGRVSFDLKPRRMSPFRRFSRNSCGGGVAMAAAGRSPLDLAAVVKKRLEEGRTISAITRDLRMSRVTVRLIRDGRWKRMTNSCLPPLFVPPGREACPPRRCPTCRGKVVVWPCLACASLGRGAGGKG